MSSARAMPRAEANVTDVHLRIWNNRQQVTSRHLMTAAEGSVRDLLTSRPLIEASNREGMAEGLATLYRVRGSDFRGGETALAGLANKVVLTAVTLHYCRYEVETTIRFPRMDGFRQFFCLQGAGEVSEGGKSLSMARSRTGILPPNSRFDAIYSAGYRHLVVQFDEALLRRKLDLLQGGVAIGPLDLPTFQSQPSRRIRRLRDVALALAAQFDGGRAPNPILLTELEQALVTSFLVENGALRGADKFAKAGSAHVRRLEEYIHAHWAEPLTVSSIAIACGVSVRSVYLRFRQQHHCSPLAYIRMVRLDQAHAMLSAKKDVSVLDVALRCGFASFGHFANRYRERFGELPSQTRARAG